MKAITAEDTVKITVNDGHDFLVPVTVHVDAVSWIDLPAKREMQPKLGLIFSYFPWSSEMDMYQQIVVS